MSLNKKSDRKRNRAKDDIAAVFSLCLFTDYKMALAVIGRYSKALLSLH